MEAEMRTVGVDLAAQPRHTAVCVVRWSSNVATVSFLPGDDATIVEAARAATMTGIDVPFGWPRRFVEAVAAHAQGRPWPGDPRTTRGRDELRFRLTDLVVADVVGRRPLSVSTDLIGVPAMRAAALLDRLGVVDRSRGPVVEVYPAGALACWGLPSTGYKGRARGRVLPDLVDGLLGRLPWLQARTEDRERLAVDDDAFDALVCALVARAAATGRTRRPDPVQAETARIEGWIHLPGAGVGPDRLIDPGGTTADGA